MSVYWMCQIVQCLRHIKIYVTSVFVFYKKEYFAMNLFEEERWNEGKDGRNNGRNGVMKETKEQQMEVMKDW